MPEKLHEHQRPLAKRLDKLRRHARVVPDLTGPPQETQRHPHDFAILVDAFEFVGWAALAATALSAECIAAVAAAADAAAVAVDFAAAAADAAAVADVSAAAAAAGRRVGAHVLRHLALCCGIGPTTTTNSDPLRWYASIW